MNLLLLSDHLTLLTSKGDVCISGVAKRGSLRQQSSNDATVVELNSVLQDMLWPVEKRIDARGIPF